MADPNVTPARPGLTPTIWDDQYFSEYVRTNQFAEVFRNQMDSHDTTKGRPDPQER